MYTLYYTTRSYTTESTSMIPHIALEEIGARYEIVEVELEPSPPDWYLALNPQGKIPTLIDRGAAEDGETVVYPSAAILFHLADRHPEAGLAPAPGTAARGLCYRTVCDMAEMLQVCHMMNSYPERFSGDPAHEAAIRAKAAEWLATYWGRIDEALVGQDYLLGDSFSLCDVYMYVIARWTAPHHKPISDFANVTRTCASVERRPAVRRVLAGNDVDPIVG